MNLHACELNYNSRFGGICMSAETLLVFLFELDLENHPCQATDKAIVFFPMCDRTPSNRNCR